MGFDIDAAPLRAFLENLARGATVAQWAWQLGVAALSVALGYFAARIVCREIRPSPRWKFGEGDFQMVAFPLFTYGFLLVSKAILARYQAVYLLQILQSLLVAWIVIRLAMYVLGHVLPHGSFLRGSIRTIALLAWVAVALHVTGLLPDIIEALDDIGFSIGKDKQRITLWVLLQAVIALAATLAVSAWISRVVESRVMAAPQLEMTTKIVLSRLVHAVTVLLAVLIVLPLVGIPLTALSIFSGAMGVGLGFGLQKIASNYVSGFIVLLEKSLRIGDIITVDGRRGEVVGIHSRFTVIKGNDGVESIIPNEKLITESVNHHTYSDPRISVVIAVSVPFEADVDRALELLLAAAKKQQRVIAEPAASARIKAFSDFGVVLELTVWISDPAVGDAEIRSEIHRELLASYRAAGIELASPRRDVRLVATPAITETSSQSST